MSSEDKALLRAFGPARHIARLDNRANVRVREWNNGHLSANDDDIKRAHRTLRIRPIRRYEKGIRARAKRIIRAALDTENADRAVIYIGIAAIIVAAIACGVGA